MKGRIQGLRSIMQVLLLLLVLSFAAKAQAVSYYYVNSYIDLSYTFYDQGGGLIDDWSGYLDLVLSPETEETSDKYGTAVAALTAQATGDVDAGSADMRISAKGYSVGVGSWASSAGEARVDLYLDNFSNEPLSVEISGTYGYSAWTRVSDPSTEFAIADIALDITYTGDSDYSLLDISESLVDNDFADIVGEVGTYVFNLEARSQASLLGRAWVNAECDPPGNSVPEPATLYLLPFSFLILAAFRRRFRKPTTS